MIKKTEKLQQAQTMLSDSYSSVRYEHLRSLQLKLLGIDRDVLPTTHQVKGNGMFIWYPHIVNIDKIETKPNRILNNVRLLTAQTRTIEIVPQWTNLSSELKGTARDACWVQRSQGIGGYGGWKDDLDRCFMDFSAIGVGVLRAAVLEEGDYSRICAKYRSPLHCGTDPYVSSPSDSDWYWDADLWSVDQLKARWPKVKWDGYCEDNLTQENLAYKSAIIIEFFNKNPDNNLPGYVAMVGDFDGEIIEVGKNPFGNITPNTHFCNFTPPGARYPVGLVETQSYAVKRIDEIDEIIKEVGDRLAMMMVDAELMDPDSWKKLKDGKNPRFIPFGEGWNATARQEKRVAFQELPRIQVPADLWQERNFWEQYLRESSGVTSSMAGVTNPTQRTATEVQNVAQQSAAQTAFLSREFARGYQQFASKVAMIAEMYDTAPFYVSYGGIEVEFNDGSDQMTTSAQVWAGPKTAVIGEEMLVNTDVNAKRQLEGQKWKEIYALTQNPEAIKSYLESQGIKEVDKYAMMPPPQNDLGAQVA